MTSEREPPADRPPGSPEMAMPPESVAPPASTAAEPTLTRTVAISNKRGLHARAAAKFVTLAERFGACVEVCRDGQSVSARSIMGLMMLGSVALVLANVLADVLYAVVDPRVRHG